MADGTIMHLDGCHFYVWVYERDGVQRLSWAERAGSNLFSHRDPHCPRCAVLRGGVAPQAFEVEIEPLPQDGRAAFVKILSVIAADERMIA